MTQQFIKGAAAVVAGLFITVSAVQAAEPLIVARGMALLSVSKNF
ncbi:MAG: hypothetical protein VYB45_07295 [Pseudomonadota bacterium]|jgi:hypothetical protein|nr:hypothetical protein [Pseudomonadota bacterium]|tara:strand:+ start:308 stop:442 length:135 start_codon:yes stop_codon:yes gene_type:complete